MLKSSRLVLTICRISSTDAAAASSPLRCRCVRVSRVADTALLLAAGLLCGFRWCCERDTSIAEAAAAHLRVMTCRASAAAGGPSQRLWCLEARSVRSAGGLHWRRSGHGSAAEHCARCAGHAPLRFLLKRAATCHRLNDSVRVLASVARSSHHCISRHGRRKACSSDQLTISAAPSLSHDHRR